MIDPREDSKICKDCLLRRSCAQHIGIPPCAKQFLEPVVQPISNNDYTKCADEVLKIINYSHNSSHGRRIIECIKRHFA